MPWLSWLSGWFRQQAALLSPCPHPKATHLDVDGAVEQQVLLEQGQRCLRAHLTQEQVQLRAVRLRRVEQ